MSMNLHNEEMILNGILDEEVEKYFHICFYTDDQGPDLESPEDFIFIPKPVCRIVDDVTVSIQEWYVKKKKLLRYVRGRRRAGRSTIGWSKLKKVTGTGKPAWKKM